MKLTRKQADLIQHGTEYAWERYVTRYIRRRVPHLEPFIRQWPSVACAYAKYGVQDRWPEGEGIMATHPWYAYVYARFIVRDRCPELESAIRQNSRSENRIMSRYE
jgi:hypothetical protein